MDENELYEAFGVEPEAGEQEREPAEPASTDLGANGQEVAQPAENETNALPVTGEVDPAGESEETPAVMDEAERHRQAEIRREAERAEQERATAAAVDKAYADAYNGKLNPYTRKPITSKADYEEYQAQYLEDQKSQQMAHLRAAGIDPAMIQTMVDQHPDIQQARAEREKAQTEQARTWFKSQEKEIQAVDPEVKSLDDLAQRDPGQYTKMLEMVGRGVSMVDAYKAINFDALAQKRSAAAQQAVRNQAAGKAHLTPSAGQGNAGVEVPASIKDMYREMGLEMSDAEISKSYEEYMKSQK